MVCKFVVIFFYITLTLDILKKKIIRKIANRKICHLLDCCLMFWEVFLPHDRPPLSLPAHMEQHLGWVLRKW